MDNKNLLRQNADDLTGDLPKYPSLQDYMNGMNGLLKLDLKSMDQEAISRSFFDKAILFQQAFGTNAKDNFNGQKFYRVRMNIGNEEDPDLIRTHSYPPQLQCKINGRANLKGKSVFYCSNRPLTSMAEARPESGSIGYLSVWQATTVRDVKYGICLPAELRKENDFNFMAEGIHKFVKNNSLQEAGEKAEHFQFYFRFITERFISEECPYPLSSWIANEMLFGEHWKDFIIYPSVANQTYACNMAFHPNSADALLKFEKVVKFTVDQFVFPQIRLSKVKIGEIVNSRITWHTATDSEMEYIIPGARKL